MKRGGSGDSRATWELEVEGGRRALICRQANPSYSLTLICRVRYDAIVEDMRYEELSIMRYVLYRPKGAITSKIKHVIKLAIKLKTQNYCS